MTTTLFGSQNGRPVHSATIRSGAMALEVIEHGAVIRDMTVAVGGTQRRVVLGLKTLEDYIRHSPHLGAVAGRVANRTRDARFAIDGTEHRVAVNRDGGHQLHGGPEGFGVSNWTITHADDSRIVLALHDPAGHNGYPGSVDATCRYELTDDTTLRITLTATTDAATPINLATHSYFNLADTPDARDHRIAIDGRFYTPLDKDLITTGEIRATAGTPYDFADMKPIRAGAIPYDINYMLGFPGPDGLGRAARLESPGGDVALEVWTSEPCVQFYDAAGTGIPVEGLHAWRYGAHCGICLEPQRVPNAVNTRHFGAALLRPDEVYRQVTEYRFFA